MDDCCYNVGGEFRTALRHSEAESFAKSDGTGGKFNEKKPKGLKKQVKKWKKTR